MVKIHACRVKNARKMSNLAALFSLQARIFPQKTASQAECQHALVQPRRAGWGTGFRRYRQAASSCQRPSESLLLPAPLCSPNKPSGTTEHWQDEPCRRAFSDGLGGVWQRFRLCADTDKKGRLKPCFAAFRRLQTGWQSESAVCVFAAFKKPPDCRHSRAGGNLGAGQSGILLSERFRTPKRFPSARE